MTSEQISQTFRNARLQAVPLAAYPAAQVPASLAEAYAIQQMSIDAWDDHVVGWKVAAIAPQWRDGYPAERVAGPVFSRTLVQATAGVAELPIIRGGYAAVEAEFALLLGADFPRDTSFASTEQLQRHVAAVHAAVELAGSPLPNLSALGPGAVISDFGNNTGLLIGPALPDFFSRAPADWQVESRLNGSVAGSGSAERIPGGVLAALRFLANSLVERGESLQPGDWISTGASTGIHPVQVGDTVEVTFDGMAPLALRIVQAEAQL
jgi:2-keto-4-pentenoate hydratase